MAGGARSDRGGRGAALVDIRTAGRRRPGTAGRRPGGAGEGAAGAAARLPALDGLRAFAVLAVLAYHAGLPWARGGLLGVDAFFVLSGFLITGLLVGEWRRTGRIGLRRFWARRARRLLPALLLVLVAVAGYARWVAEPADVRSLRLDALSTLGYVANWRFALSHQGYFAHFAAPSPLLHTWSLGVEEQFYLLWPLVAVLVLRRRSAVSGLGAVAALGAAASAAVMLALTGTDASRLYYGTDTRAQALLVGAALAAWRALRGFPATRRARAGLLAAGLAGAASTLWCWLAVDGQAPLLYRGGFLVVAVAVAAVVACVVELPASPPARLLSLAPLAYLGRISYGLYLWHWPAFLVLTAERTGLAGAALLGARLAATLAFAVLSYHLVESPVRRGAPRRPRARLLTPVTVGLTALTVLVGTNAAAGTGAPPASALDALAARELRAPPPAAPATPARPVRVLLVGDSVALTLGMGLVDASAGYGTQVVDRGVIGCGVTRGMIGDDGRQQFFAWEDCRHWPDRFRGYVRQLDPDVVAVLVGRWETIDRRMDGRWVHVGDPAYDAYLLGELDLAIRVLSSRGARVALLTAPAFVQRERPDGGTYPQDDPARVARFNALLRIAAGRRPGLAEVVELGGVLSPDGRFHRRLGGVEVRWSDGVHITVEGGRLVARTVLPELARLGRPRPAGTAPARPAAARP